MSNNLLAQRLKGGSNEPPKQEKKAAAKPPVKDRAKREKQRPDDLTEKDARLAEKEVVQPVREKVADGGAEDDILGGGAEFSSVLRRNSTKPQVPSEENRFDEEFLQSEEAKEVAFAEYSEKRSRKIRRLVTIVFSVACIYLVILIYGVAMTRFQYEDSGEIAPQVLSVSDLRERKAFETVLVQYEKCRILYENILLLDYRLGQGVEDPLVISPEYAALLDDKKNQNNLSNLIIKTKALEVDAKYAQIKNMLLNWLDPDVGWYLQNITKGISENNEEAAKIAISYKQQMYSDFSILTQNIIAIGEEVPGVDLIEIKKWTPESYVENYFNSEG